MYMYWPALNWTLPSVVLWGKNFCAICTTGGKSSIVIFMLGYALDNSIEILPDPPENKNNIADNEHAFKFRCIN